tara:strand:+ start:302 stop:490 length:189 start_codon:yes stop_codon:yes gene_type:complete
MNPTTQREWNGEQQFIQDIEKNTFVGSREMMQIVRDIIAYEMNEHQYYLKTIIDQARKEYLN